MYHLRKISLILVVLLSCLTAWSQQAQFSLATDFSVLRSFKKGQQFWAVGQSVAGHFHFTPRNGIYGFFDYYTKGKFSNMQLVASAKSVATTPQQIIYNNSSQLSFKHLSFGWKHYLVGAYNIEKEWSLYGYAGLGLMMGQVQNNHSLPIDTADYNLPVLAGKANFKRLTLDLGLGFEVPLGGDVFMYLEGRTLIPTSDYPSPYILNNKYDPFTGAANIGFRILFD